jgi:orotidine-5'-phosphate decarboxylase
LEEVIIRSEKITDELEEIVRSTVGEVSAYKMNEQSMLTFLIAGKSQFVYEIKKLYKDICEDKFGISIVPPVWIDQKLRDIPSTTYQTAEMLYSLGFDAIHCMPQIGPDVSGALQLAAVEYGMKGTIHVINMTHDGYKYVKDRYFQTDALEKMRLEALSSNEFEVDIGKKTKIKVNIRATGVIEPANRPSELYRAFRSVYRNKVMIICIGIGLQGALPGCALYSGATCEGIGRFIFERENGIESNENMREKARRCKRSALMALKARYSRQPYPLKEITDELREFSPKIRDETRLGLEEVYQTLRDIP